MKFTIFGLALVLFAASPAFAQNWTGTSGGLAGSGISKPTFSGGSGGGGGGNGGGGGGNSSTRTRQNTETPRYVKPRKTEEQKEWEKHNKTFHKLIKEKDSEKLLSDWLALARASGWASAWYNYAATAWRLGQNDLALAEFKQLITYCPGEADICASAKKSAVSIEEESAYNAYQQGNYSASADAYRSASQLDPTNPEPLCNLSSASMAWAVHAPLDSGESIANDAMAAAKSCTDQTSSNDPYRAHAVAVFYSTWTNIEYMKARKIMSAGYVGWSADAISPLRAAVLFDNLPGACCAYNARAALANVLHVQGRDSEAEMQADIALLQHPGDEYAQNVLDLINPMPRTQGGHAPNKCTSIIVNDDTTVPGYASGARTFSCQ